MALALCLLHIKLASRRGQDGSNRLVKALHGSTLAAEWVDEHLHAFPPQRGPISAVQQLLYPRLYLATVGLVQGVADDGWSDDLLGDGVGILDGDFAIFGVLSPEDVVEGDRTSGFVVCCDERLPRAAAGGKNVLPATERPQQPRLLLSEIVSSVTCERGHWRQHLSRYVHTQDDERVGAQRQRGISAHCKRAGHGSEGRVAERIVVPSGQGHGYPRTSRGCLSMLEVPGAEQGAMLLHHSRNGQRAQMGAVVRLPTWACVRAEAVAFAEA